MKNPQQVVLLRVGIDTGCGGINGPIFANRSFEFIPIDADYDSKRRTYGNTRGRHGQMFIDYFRDGRRKERMRDKPMHFDPEFATYTYGDPTRPKQSLRKLKRGDLLVFYAGLEGCRDCKTPASLYIIGYFIVAQAGTYADFTRKEILQLFADNQHILNGGRKGEEIGDGAKLILIKGGRGSRLLTQAVKISADKKAKDRGGHPVFVLDPVMQRHFGNFTSLNAIQRSTPRWVKPEFCEKAAAFVTALR
jgi:hypothetical protein